MDIYDIVLDIYKRTVDKPEEMEIELIKFIVFLLRNQWQYSEFKNVLVLIITILLTHLYAPSEKRAIDSMEKKLINFFLSQEFN